MENSSSNSWYSRLAKVLVSTVWPWIVKNLWPEIQKRIVDIFLIVIDGLIRKFINSVTEQKAKQAESALQRATAAEKMADHTQDKTEADQYRAIAKVWREVAEDFRRENETLQQRLNALAAQSVSDFEQNVASLHIENMIEESKGGLRLRDSKQKLPPLPSPNEMEEDKQA